MYVILHILRTQEHEKTKRATSEVSEIVTDCLQQGESFPFVSVFHSLS